MGLLNKHENNDQQNRIRKSEKNVHESKPGKPEEIYGGIDNPKPKQKKQYASLRVAKNTVCKLSALRDLCGDHNISITIDRMVDHELPKFLTDKKKKIFFEGLVDSYNKSIGGNNNR